MFAQWDGLGPLTRPPQTFKYIYIYILSRSALADLNNNDYGHVACHEPFVSQPQMSRLTVRFFQIWELLSNMGLIFSACTSIEPCGHS